MHTCAPWIQNCVYNIIASFPGPRYIILCSLSRLCYIRAASSPGSSQHFQYCMRKAEGPGIRSHMTNFMKGGQRVKMNMGEAKVSEVQDAAVHDLLGIRL